jgi:hypothetical protein
MYLRDDDLIPCQPAIEITIIRRVTKHRTNSLQAREAAPSRLPLTLKRIQPKPSHTLGTHHEEG